MEKENTNHINLNNVENKESFLEISIKGNIADNIVNPLNASESIYNKKNIINNDNNNNKYKEKLNLKKNQTQSGNKKKQKGKNFNFASFDINNQAQINSFIECINIYESITESYFYAPSEIFLYYRSNITKFYTEKCEKHKGQLARVVALWESLESSEKAFYVAKANDIASAILRKKFDVEKSILKAIRYEIISESLLKKIHNDFLHKKCTICWLLNKNCICKKIEAINFKANLYILLHNKEFLRASNTSKILQLMKIKSLESNKGHKEHPQTILNIEFIIIGIWEHEKKIEKLSLQQDNFIENSIILYPDKKSIPVDEFLKNNLTRFNQDEHLMNENLQNMNIFILDGTWTQAKHLKYFLDSLALKKSNSNKLQSIIEDQDLDDDYEISENESNNKDMSLDEEVSGIENYNNKIHNPFLIQTISIDFEKENKKNIFNNLRKAHSNETCSTLEAIAILLKHFGYDEDIYQSITNNMKLFIEILCQQSRKKFKD